MWFLVVKNNFIEINNQFPLNSDDSKFLSDPVLFLILTTTSNPLFLYLTDS